MQFFKTPFLAVLVFGVGMGIGLAWKNGWIPVELGAANTGILSGDRDDSAELGQPPQVPVEPADDPDLFASQATAPVAAEPKAEWEQGEQPGRATVASRVVPDPGPIEAETPREPNKLDWVAETRPPQKLAEPPRRFKSAIKLAAPEAPAGANLEPSRSASVPLADELKAIDEQIANDEILPAHRALSKLYWNHEEARGELLQRLEQTSRTIFFEPRPHLIEPYVVQPNDQLRVIANKYQLTWEYLAKLNRTEPKRIQLGQKLKVLKGPFAGVVDLSNYALTIHLQGYYVRRYQVGIGKDGASPIGKFAVQNKVDNPQYTGPDGKVISADDPSNPLGERWIDLGDSYGIHGTIEPDSIGKAASRGCIRMRDKDVIEVYDFLVKGSEVVIRK
jgi:L,D-transpeptidase ErfK/SrfK